jgi:hypothetical protein
LTRSPILLIAFTCFVAVSPFAHADSLSLTRSGTRGLRAVGFAPLSPVLTTKWESPPARRYALRSLGRGVECLFRERVKSAGFLSTGANDKGLSVQAAIFEALGEAYYAKFPWEKGGLMDVFSAGTFVWERSLADGRALFDADRVYADIGDWLSYAKLLRDSPCHAEAFGSRLTEDKSRGLSYVRDAGDGSFLAWSAQGAWVGVAIASPEVDVLAVIDNFSSKVVNP